MQPRVLVLIDTAKVGGPGKGILQLLRHLPNKKVSLTIGTFQSNRHQSTEFIERVQKQGNIVEVFHEHFRYDVSLIRQIHASIQRYEINIIQSHGYKAHAFAFLLSRFYGLPWIGVMNGWTDENWKVRFYHSLDRIFLRFASNIIAVSSELYESAHIFAPHVPSHTILNAIDANDLVEKEGGKKIREKLGANELVIGSFGRLSPEKGHALLINAFAEALPFIPPCRLILVGEGSQREVLESLITQHGLERYVTICGYQTAMKDYYDAIDLFVLPSYREGLPNVVLESMVQEIPVISSDIPAVKDLIQDQVTGWLFKCGDRESLKQSLIHALTSSDSQWRNITVSAHAQLFPRYCPMRRAEQFLGVYKNLMATSYRKPGTEVRASAI